MPKSEFDDVLFVVAMDRIDVGGPFTFDAQLAALGEPMWIHWRVEQPGRVARGLVRFTSSANAPAPPPEVTDASGKANGWWDREVMRDLDAPLEAGHVFWKDGPAVATGLLVGASPGSAVIEHWTQTVQIRLLVQPVIDP